MLMTPAERQALRVGEFRLQGEVHQWMYDRYGLARLMLLAGFVSPVVQTAAGSQIPKRKRQEFSAQTSQM